MTGGDEVLAQILACAGEVACGLVVLGQGWTSVRRPASWTLHATTATLDCADLGFVPVRDGIAEIDLPGPAVFTLVGSPPRPASPEAQRD